jgi:aspartyl-tRNA(Asn)/glutamyl-tRNA(Gln) amidotransferase subunit C
VQISISVPIGTDLFRFLLQGKTALLPSPRGRRKKSASHERISASGTSNDEEHMSVDTDTVKRVARLARIKVSEEDATRMTGELNAILGFVEQLDEVDISGVEPLTSVVEQTMKKRADGVTDGNKAADITLNAPASEDHFFMVPKVVE